ncbi:MAG TPA: phospholipase D-like domain-containing protein [Burkholderiaceae bacterium]|jgi:cardiolipin synthase
MRSLNYRAENCITLLHCGAEFFPALIKAIDGARSEISLETYIFSFDPTAREVKLALTRAAARGVRIQVVTDWVGTGRIHSALLHQELVQAGIEHREFNPWFRRGIARNHRKLCVVDLQTAFVGGLNIIDDLLADDDTNQTLPLPRWDFAVQIEGPLVQDIHGEIEDQWFRLGKLKIKSRWELFRQAYKQQAAAASDGPMLAALVVRDNLRNRRTIQRSYLQAIGRARASVLIANPYFAPGRKLRRALEQAVERGVDVTLLLGVGQFKLQDSVAHSFYPKLLECGVKVVEYRRTQLHAKVAVVDDDWATIGSSNYDGLSLFVNHEANVVVKDKDFAARLRSGIEDGIAAGVPVALADYADIPGFKRVWYGLAVVVYQTIIRVVTWSKYV